MPANTSRPWMRRVAKWRPMKPNQVSAKFTYFKGGYCHHCCSPQSMTPTLMCPGRGIKTPLSSLYNFGVRLWHDSWTSLSIPRPYATSSEGTGACLSHCHPICCVNDYTGAISNCQAPPPQSSDAWRCCCAELVPHSAIPHWWAAAQATVHPHGCPGEECKPGSTCYEEAGGIDWCGWGGQKKPAGVQFPEECPGSSGFESQPAFGEARANHSPSRGIGTGIWMHAE